MPTFADLQQASATLTSTATLRWSAESHASLAAVGSLSAQTKRILDGGGVEVDGQAELAAVATIVATATTYRAASASLAAVATWHVPEGSSASIEHLVTQASDHPYGASSAALEAMTTDASDPTVAPSYGVSAAYLVPLIGDGECLTGQIGQADASMYGLRWLASNKPYAGSEPVFLVDGETTFHPSMSVLPYLYGIGDDGLGPNDVAWLEYLGFYTGVFGNSDTNAALFSGVEATDSISAVRSLLDSIMSDVGVTGAVAGVAEYGVSIIVTVAVYASTAGPTTFVTWVINANTSAATMYEGFEFTSFFIHDGKHYGVTADGIYLLDGDDDDGVDIDAYLLTGKDDFGDSKLKRVPYVYVGAAANEGLELTTHTDGDVTFTYPLEAGDTLGNLRAKIGKGLRSRYWQFEIRNLAGGSFTIESVEPLPTLQDRRIK